MAGPVAFGLDGDIAVITVNSPPVNALGHAVRQGLVDAIMAAKAAHEAKSVLIWCEGRTFFAGADIGEFGKPLRPPALPDVLRFIEDCGKPVVAAIHGTALGGGLELALHCHYRIADPGAKVGLPEVALGLLPGAGGTQRLPRIVGAEIALDLMTSGKAIGARQAFELGVIDRLAGAGSLRADAAAFARSVAGAPPPRVRDRNDKIALARGKPEIFAEFRKRNAKAFKGFKAPENIIRAVEAAVELPFDEGMKRERALFEDLYASKEAAAQRYVFFAERQTAKIPDLPADAPIRKVERVAVVGAGTMGGGIAMNFLNIGAPVTLIDQSQDALDRGISVMRRNYEASVRKGRMSEADLERRMALLSPALDYAALAGADLIIEAVFEHMPVKQDVFARIDRFAREGAILTTNTSYLDVDEIARATSRPADVAGLHFFSPANVMPLLEVVRGARTSSDVLNTLMQLARRIGKTPVLSRVGPGFIANRVMTVRGREANRMALEGTSPADIDRAMTDYGFAVGPFQMFDIVGLDVIGRGSTAKTAAAELVRIGRLGQKQGGGYYDYDENRNATLSSVALDVIADVAAQLGVAQSPAGPDEILERLLYPVVNEGAAALAEGIALRGSDIDIACVKGYNWPVYRGGPMFWADTVGLDRIIGRLDDFATRYGSQFTPSAFLVKAAAEGARLSDFGPK